MTRLATGLLAGAALWSIGIGIWIAGYAGEPAAVLVCLVPLLFVTGVWSALRRRRRWVAGALSAATVVVSLLFVLVGGLLFLPTAFLLACATAVSPAGAS